MLGSEHQAFLGYAICNMDPNPSPKSSTWHPPQAARWWPVADRPLWTLLGPFACLWSLHLHLHLGHRPNFLYWPLAGRYPVTIELATEFNKGHKRFPISFLTKKWPLLSLWWIIQCTLRLTNKSLFPLIGQRYSEGHICNARNFAKYVDNCWFKSSKVGETAPCSYPQADDYVGIYSNPLMYLHYHLMILLSYVVIPWSSNMCWSSQFRCLRTTFLGCLLAHHVLARHC